MASSSAASPSSIAGSSSSGSSATFTSLPTVGQRFNQGQVLYQVNAQPVVLLYGSTPAYRALSEGMTGPDVTELNADLVALGYATSSELSPTSDYFSSETFYALEKLQVALGVTETGTLVLGQAVFLPTAVLVTSVTATLGGPAQAGAIVLTATATARQVDVALDASQQSEVAVGDKVAITLPNNLTHARGHRLGGHRGHRSLVDLVVRFLLGLLGQQRLGLVGPDRHCLGHPDRSGGDRQLGPGSGQCDHHHWECQQCPGGTGQRPGRPVRWWILGRGRRRQRCPSPGNRLIGAL